VTTYIFRRLITVFIVIIIVSVMVFLAIRLLPGDPILVYLSQGDVASLSPAEIAKAKHEFGLDKPIYQQYGIWIWDLLHGNWGKSLFYREEVSKLIKERLPISLNISLIAFILNIPLSIGAGLICALKRGKAADNIITSFAIFGISVPIFWLGILMILFFGLKFHLLPLSGYTSPFEDLGMNFRQLILPIICLMIGGLAGACRQTRSSVLEVIRQDYIRTAWSKGLRERTIVLRHVLKNALIPVLTLKGMALGHILGGNVLIETVFNIPGIGRLAVDATFSQDYTVVQATVLITALMVVLSNLIVDISYGWLDPRIRYS
jgi:peptide/nickel transport system permease protein